MWWHTVTQGGEVKGNWQMEWVASTLQTTSEHGVSSITTADAHNSAASSRLKWRLRQFKWTRTFRRKTKSGSYACAITFQLVCTTQTCALLSFLLTYPLISSIQQQSFSCNNLPTHHTQATDNDKIIRLGIGTRLPPQGTGKSQILYTKKKVV
jgi:hypothetical protein